MDPVSDHRVRVTLAQRDRAVALLRQAVADQRLTFDELNQRLPQAMAATTRGDLHAIVDDLLPAQQVLSLLNETGPQGDGPGMPWEHPLTFSGKRWRFRTVAPRELPPFVELVGGFIRFYCTEATALTPVIDLMLTGVNAVEIIVPEGWGVDGSQLYGVRVDSHDSGRVGLEGTQQLLGLSSAGETTVSIMSMFDTQVSSRPAPGSPRILLHSTSQKGKVKARYPKPCDLRRLARHEARQLARRGRATPALGQ